MLDENAIYVLMIALFDLFNEFFITTSNVLLVLNFLKCLNVLILYIVNNVIDVNLIRNYTYRTK